MSGSSSNHGASPSIIATASSSAAGGRVGWQGLRFEAAFATLNLIRSALSRSPLGLDGSTLRPIAEPDRIQISYKPQTEGAVDDLVALDGGRRIVAYQLKSGTAQLPRSVNTASETVSALEQAGRELRASDGATVVILVFGQLSPLMKTFARWLVDDSSSKPAIANQNTIAQILGYDPANVDWQILRPRIRFLEMRTTAAIGGSIDTELSCVYSSPADRLAVSDAIRELVAFHSDTTGASLPAISVASLDAWLAQRGLPALTAQRRLDTSVPVIARIADQFLSGVYRDRGPLPEIARTKLVEHIVSELQAKDIALLGGGGNGKTEIEAQVLRHMLSDGWMPLVLRREDLSQSSDLASLIGAGGRTSIAKLVTDLLGQEHPERVLILIDGLDELRRISPTAGQPRATELFDVLSGLRAICTSHDQLRILVSCRKYDWDKLRSSGWSASFSTILLPDMSIEDLAKVQQMNLSPFSEFLASLSDTLLCLLRSRPILLRLAFELWLHRRQVAGINSAPNLDDLTSEVQLWLRYYDECVCRSDEGLTSAIPSGDVIRCHEAMARMHIEGDLFILSVPARPLERDYALAFPWLRSLDVAVPEGQPPSSRVRFFHPAYTDFALAQVLAEDQGVSLEWARREQLAVSLFPVWQRIPAFWAISIPDVALHRTREMLQDDLIPYVVKHALIDGWFERDLDEGTLVELASIVATYKGKTALLQHFISTATAAATTTGHLISAAGWIRTLTSSAQLDDVDLNHLLCSALKLVESRAGEDGPLYQVVRILSNRGIDRAGQLASSEDGIHNARLLARNAVTLLSYALRSEVIGTLPIETSSWSGVGDNNRAAELASDSRFMLTQEDAVLRMHMINPDETRRFLIRVLTTSSGAQERMVPMNAPQQTARLNFSQGLNDGWSLSWYSIGRILPQLLTLNYVCYLEVSIAAWMMVGRLWRSSSVDEGTRYPTEVAGDPWLHDASYLWWENGSRGYEWPAHCEIARLGFSFVAKHIAEADLAPLKRLIALLREARWAGLVGVTLRIVASGLESPNLGPAARSEAAALAVDVVLEQRSFYYTEFRYHLANTLPILIPYLDSMRQQRIWENFSELINLDRISAEIIQKPDLEITRKQIAAKVESFKKKTSSLPPDAIRWREGAGLAYMQSRAPEALYEQQMKYYEHSIGLRNAAAQGTVPWQHQDVEWVLSAVGEFYTRSIERLVPQALQDLRTAFIAEFGETALPQSRPAFYITSSMSPVARPPVEPTADPHSSVAGFRSYVTELYHQRLNSRSLWSGEEKSRLKVLIERWNPASCKEVSIQDDEHQNEINEETQRSHRTAWLQLLVQYLEWLTPGMPHELGDDIVSTALMLSADSDPVEAIPASLDGVITTRGLAAEALALLRWAGSTSLATKSFTSLLHDRSPAVRQSVYYRAQWLRRVDSEAYNQILKWFAENESDQFLLWHWGPPCLFGKTYSPQDLALFDYACATMLSRNCPTGSRSSDAPVANPDAGNPERILHIAVFVALNGGVKSFGELKRLVEVPAWQLSFAAIAQKIIAEVMVNLSSNKCDSASALNLLSAFQSRAQQSAQAASLSQTPTGLAHELSAVTEVVASLGAALIGVSHGGRLALTEADVPSSPRLSRLAPGIAATERSLYALWRDIVLIWGRSSWKLSMQRLLCDAFYVMFEYSHDDCSNVASMLVQLDLISIIPRIEYSVKVALNRLMIVLLDAPESIYPQRTRQHLLLLLQALATSGHMDSITAIHRVAERARQS